MEFIRFVLGRSGKARLLLFGAVIAGSLSGLASVALLDLLKQALESAEEGPVTHLAMSFLLLCLLVTATRLLSQYLLVGLGQRLVMDLRLELGEQILATPLRSLESMGANRIYATLTDDVNSVTQALVTVPVLCVNGTIIIGCFAYLAWLHLVLFAIFLGLVLLGVVIYQLLARFAMNRFREVREEQDTLFQHFRGLGEGVKELQLHQHRRGAFIDLIRGTSDSIRKQRISATMIFGLASAWGNLLFFATLGLIFFARPSAIQVDSSTLIAYTVVLFYVMTPLQFFLDSIPTLGRAGIAVEKIDQLGFSLGEPMSLELVGEFPVRWNRLELQQLTHQYRRDDQEHPFTLGPVDLTLQPGEVLFLVGGNGSGKTTLAKILVGLYAPDAGRIVVDGREVTGENRDAYRQLFSVIFDDFFLFEQLLGLEGEGLEERAAHYLEALRIAHKVQVEGQRLSTLELSKGQRKRLALLTAYLENRPIYLFDEWAADQDPMFKDVFYRQILPDLRDKGKMVVVISHDDRYFHLGDQLLKLEDGHVAYSGPAKHYQAGISSPTLT
ncbi:MAG: cyclic peptide export ABC transporter [Acidobacteriota bacterium]|nr:cyclic peptide export ABC transporter [Acidobacteriota bacterium]